MKTISASEQFPRLAELICQTWQVNELLEKIQPENKATVWQVSVEEFKNRAAKIEDKALSDEFDFLSKIAAQREVLA